MLTGDGCNSMDFPNDYSKEWLCLGSNAPILLGNWEMNGYQPWNGTVISLAKLDVLASLLHSLTTTSCHWGGHVPGVSWNSTAMVLAANVNCGTAPQ